MEPEVIHVYGTLGLEVDGHSLARYIASYTDESDEEGKKPFEVRINTYGGDLSHAYSIYSALLQAKAKGCEVTTFNDGFCASGGSLIFLAGNKRKMAPYATLMVHAASQEGADKSALEAVNGGLKQAYMDITGQDEEKVKKWLSRDTWMSAEEASALGLATEIVQPSKPTATPEHIQAAIAAFNAKAQGPAPQPNNSMTQEQIAELQAKADRADALQAELDSIKAEQEAQLEAEAKEAVDKAVAAGMVEEADRAEATIQAKANMGFFAKALARFEAAKVPVKPTPAPPLFKAQASTTPAVDPATEFYALQQTNPKELARIKTEEPARFEAMQEAFINRKK